MQRPILTAVVAGAALLALTADSQANDTIRLGHAFSVPSATHAGEVLANTSTLTYHGDATTDLTHRRGWGGWGFSFYGGHRGYYGGYRGYYGGYGHYGHYHGYRPYYYGSYYHRPYYYSSYYYRPYYYSSYYTPYYYSSYPSYYYPCSDTPQMPQAVVLGSNSYYASPQGTPRVYQSVPMDQANGDQTFPYDGGPSVPPPPMPAADPTPTLQPKRPTVPLEGKIVKLPNASSSFTYTAYGETPAVRANVGSSVPVYVSVPVSTTTTKSPYKAYGEK